ncbi:16911_t:CDS:2 [Funneliformis mosseae]|uniref:16911_t:CDS:1 n=1 Tax=Funneliformis mosseae TaxID=27381 RepID=A0A9N8ZV88_FUNMO|nr:16911_t:CDS:2 [Funneliformis mosseae]
MPYASGLSYNDLRKNLIPDLSTLDENQIIDLIYFPCYEHCIKVNDVSNVNVLLNPTLRTNQISLENKQAGNWQVQKQLLAFMIDCQSIKIKLMKQKKKEHDVIARNAYDDSSSPSDTSPKTYSFKVDKKVSIETCEAFTSMFSFSERISEMLQPSSIKVTSDHCNFNCHEYQRVVFAIMEFEKQIESLTPLNIDVNLN